MPNRRAFLAFLLISHWVTSSPLTSSRSLTLSRQEPGMGTTGHRGGHCILFHQRGWIDLGQPNTHTAPRLPRAPWSGEKGKASTKEWLKCIPERRRDGIEWQGRTRGHWWHWQPVGLSFPSEKQAQKKQWLWHLSGREKQKLGSCAVESWGFTGMPLM